MPDNFDNEQIDNMSIDEINELFNEVIEMPEMEHIASRSLSCTQVVVTNGLF